MHEKRQARRLQEENDVAVTIVSSGDKSQYRGKTFFNQSGDVSASGARIKANVFLPVNTLLKIEMNLKTLHQMINVLGKVKWTKVVFDNESFEAGVEFFNTPVDITKKLTDYISMKQRFSALYPA